MLDEELADKKTLNLKDKVVYEKKFSTPLNSCAPTSHYVM